jgi:two-component system, NarL family, sensor histidine kinase UhpB
MEPALRILILEDLPSDVELMTYELREANIVHTYRHVTDREQFLAALQEDKPDLILSDFKLPNIEGLEALALAQANCPEAPLIFVSGAMGEEVAIDAMKRGATDYVLKDHLSRLGPAVQRALREAEDRRERRQAVAALRESEEKYRLLVKNIPSVVYKGYQDCSVDFVDGKVEELTGYSKSEFDARHLKWNDLLIWEDREKFKQAFLEGFRSSRSYVREYRIRRKDGEIIWVQDRGQIICSPLGRVEYISGVFFEITARRRAEEALQESEQRLRFLTSQLLSAQERERKRISMELHDELGQSLAVLKLQIRAIERALGEDQGDLKEGCRELLQYLDGVLDNIRRLSRDLSPAILEDLGLQSALKYLINGVSKHYTVKHSFEVDDLDHLFPSDAQIIIYRIFQECLTNISKHAGATEVSIKVKENDGFLSLVLEDNGIGFEPAQLSTRRASGRGLGLAALDERARMLGGSLEIRSQPGAGTRVTCIIPIEHVRRSTGQ